MTKIFVIFLISLASCQKKDWTLKPIEDPSKFDYCTLNCDPKAEKVDDGGGLHPACFCWPAPPRKIVHDDNLTAIIEIRKIALAQHNFLRNLSASGNETRPEGDPIPQAADMEIMNYDLELEYIARCRAINSYGSTFAKGTSHEPCRKMHDGRKTGQNLGLLQTYTPKWWWIKARVTSWYDEVDFLPDAKIVDEFVAKLEGAKGIYGHWSALIWHSMSRVGCVLLYHPDTARAHLKNNLSYTFMCNYASDHTKYGPNIYNTPIFKRGKPCSACPNNKKCNSEYTALCGELLPVPTDKPYPLMKGGGIMAWCRWYYYQWLALLLMLNFAVQRLFF